MGRVQQWTSHPENNLNIVWTYCEEIKISFQDLKQKFGEPFFSPSEKTQYEWIIKGPNGSFVVIFDLNQSDEAPFTWKVGALKKVHIQNFIKWLFKI
jgi:hypothetical protein